jgi:isoquinoline 1-oxidoreductase alpha subunit
LPRLILSRTFTFRLILAFFPFPPALRGPDGRTATCYSLRTVRGDKAMVSVKINGVAHELDVEPEMPLLWAIRNEIGLTGTKYGCGIGQCGACTVLIDNQAVRSCQMQVGNVAGKSITTIEGLAQNGVPHPVQAAWAAEDVPQCGYCQSGQIMAAVSLLNRKPNPTDADIDTITNICRCGTYTRIRRAVHRAATSKV